MQVREVFNVPGGLIVLAICISACEKDRVPVRYLIPQGQHGWFQVCYSLSGAPPLERRNGRITIDFSAGRELRTKSDLEEGWAADEYFFVSSDGRLTSIAGWPKIDGVVVRSKALVNRGHGWCQEFFVGDMEEFGVTVYPWSKPSADVMPTRGEAMVRAIDLLRALGYRPDCFDASDELIDPMSYPGRDLHGPVVSVVVFRPRACASDQRVLMFAADATRALSWSSDPQAWTETQRQVIIHAFRDRQAKCPTCKETLQDLVVSVHEDGHAYYIDLTPANLFEAPGLDGGTMFTYAKSLFGS